MTRQPETISFWRGVLPHWEVVDGRYFVTVRLANSLPSRVVEELSAVLMDATEKDYLKKSRMYFKHMEQWLDNNAGEDDKIISYILQLPEQDASVLAAPPTRLAGTLALHWRSHRCFLTWRASVLASRTER